MTSRMALAAFVCAAALCGTIPARAQVTLSQTRFEAGQNYAAFFKLGKGCGASPTVSLEISIPDDVLVLRTPEKLGWRLSAKRVALAPPVHTEGGDIKERIVSVTWRGRLDANAPDQFGLFLKLPIRTGRLYFPAVQQCEGERIAWTGAADGHAYPNAHPAPFLDLIAATAPATAMAGPIMLERAWSPATPPGATTAAVYLTIMNHGSAPDTLVGGSTPAADSVQVHQMSMANGIMTMREMKDGLAIPSGATVTMDPSQHYHLMLVGVKEPLKRGSRYPITLDFAKAGRATIEVDVAAIGARTPDGASNSGGTAMPGMHHQQ